MNEPSIPGEQRIYLYPGSIAIARVPSVITTILGSCVAVCLWDPVALRGGMNHYILPRGGSSPSPRYGNHALPMLLDEVLAIDSVHRRNLVAAIFGGASMMNSDTASLKLGERNVLEAREFLARESIAIVDEDVGGREGRKVVFRTADGSGMTRRL